MIEIIMMNKNNLIIENHVFFVIYNSKEDSNIAVLLPGDGV